MDQDGRLVREHVALRLAITRFGDDVPSVYARYRFAAKLRTYSDVLAACIDRVTAGVRDAIPGMGENIAIDGSDMPAYANGQRYVFDGGPEREQFSDPDASWGHRSAVSTRSHGGFYGYKLDMAVCAATDLPLAWNVRTARDNESVHALSLLDATRERGFAAVTCAMDKGYDHASLYAECEARDCRPSIPLRQTPDAQRARISRRRAITASGRSPDATRRAARASGAAPRGAASPRPCGSRGAVCTR